MPRQAWEQPLGTLWRNQPGENVQNHPRTFQDFKQLDNQASARNTKKHGSKRRERRQGHHTCRKASVQRSDHTPQDLNEFATPSGLRHSTVEPER